MRVLVRGCSLDLAATAGVAVFSLVMSVLGWPDARIGVAVNLAILIGLWLTGRLALD